MNTTANEVLEILKENDIKFIRLGFCDLLGNQKIYQLLQMNYSPPLKAGFHLMLMPLAAFVT